MGLKWPTVLIAFVSFFALQAVANDDNHGYYHHKKRAKYPRYPKYHYRQSRQPAEVAAATTPGPAGTGKRRRMTTEEILEAIRGPEFSAYNPPEMPHCVVQGTSRQRLRGEPGQRRKRPVLSNQDEDPCLCGLGVPDAILNCTCVAPEKSSYLHVVQKLADYLAINETLSAAFDAAVIEMAELNVSTAQCIRTTADFLSYADQILKTPPYQDGNSRNVYSTISTFYLLVDQPSLLPFQSPVVPGTTKNGTTQQQLTFLSEWLRAHSMAWGDWLDTAESTQCLATFEQDEWFCWDDYIVPEEGFDTFNHYFARHLKDGMRPLNCSETDAAVVFPADSTYVASYNISDTSTIDTGDPNEVINAKGVVWSIQELLFLSDYRDEFAGGVFAHSFLSTYNYHRWHSPISGTIVERRVISGQFYLNVTTVAYDGSIVADALDDAGYHFVQQRGLIVIEADDPDIGYVAAIPMGMAQVSSIYYTVEVGDHVSKGDELGTFYFGGSDFVVVFQEKADFHVMATPDIQYYVRQLYGWIGEPPDENPACAQPPPVPVTYVT